MLPSFFACPPCARIRQFDRQKAWDAVRGGEYEVTSSGKKAHHGMLRHVRSCNSTNRRALGRVGKRDLGFEIHADTDVQQTRQPSSPDLALISLRPSQKAREENYSDFIRKVVLALQPREVEDQIDYLYQILYCTCRILLDRTVPTRPTPPPYCQNGVQNHGTELVHSKYVICGGEHEHKPSRPRPHIQSIKQI